jgi:uncharacterized membrane-anchored protein
MAAIAGTAALVITPSLIMFDEFVIKAGIFSSTAQPLISQGLIPTILLAAAVAGFYMIMKRRFSASNNEAIQSIFILLVGALVVMTVVGVWFRGSGMELVLPWDR